MPWRRKWQSTAVLLPRESHGQRSPVGYSLWGCKELDTTERLQSVSQSQVRCLWREAWPPFFSLDSLSEKSKILNSRPRRPWQPLLPPSHRHSLALARPPSFLGLSWWFILFLLFLSHLYHHTLKSHCRGHLFPETSFLILCCGSLTKSYPILYDPVDCSTPDFSAPHHLPEFCPSSCPLNRWCHPTISLSVALFSFCPQSFPASGSFPIFFKFYSFLNQFLLENSWFTMLCFYCTTK